MIYLKNNSLDGIKVFKEYDTETVNHLLETGKWTRVKGLKDWTPYSESTSSKKKSKKTK